MEEKMRKREFLTGMGLTGMGLAAGIGVSAAIAQDYPKGKDLGAAPPEKKLRCPLGRGSRWANLKNYRSELPSALTEWLP